MVDDLAYTSEFEAGQQKSLSFSEHQYISSGGLEKGLAVDTDQQQTSATAAAARPTDKEGSDNESSAVAVAATFPSFETEDSAAVKAPPPSAEDYSCPICLELLLRPVMLSCGHRLCRGCWMNVLQGSTVHVYHRGLYCSQTGLVAAECTCTGPHENATCPLGRCRVMQTVPAVDVSLMRELYAWFGPQLTARAAEHALADEEILAKAVNARVGRVTSWTHSGLQYSVREERGGDGWIVRADSGVHGGVTRGPLSAVHGHRQRTASACFCVPLCVAGVLAGTGITLLLAGLVCLVSIMNS